MSETTNERDVVVPGEIIAEGMDFIPGYGTYRTDNMIRASRTGLLAKEGKVLKIIPLSGVYLPKANDVIIGKITDITLMGWRIDIGGPYSAMLGVKDATHDFIEKGADLTRFFDIGDYLVTKITKVTTQYLIDLSAKGPGLRKLHGGQIIKINTHKVPRIIGKKGSMVSMIKNATGCKVIVGQNGIVWIEGEPAQEVIAIDAIKKIDAESHKAGLTETIKTYLEERTGKPIPLPSTDNGNQTEQGDTHDTN